VIFWRKKKSFDLSWIKTDIHSHLLPGIDDGSPDLATSIELIKGLSEYGFKKIITTPHILWEMYPNTSEIIIAGSAEVRKKLQENNISVEFSAAAEYFLDEHFEQELKAKKPLLALKDNLVLVEFSMVTAPFDLKDLLFEMQMQNYQPLIAHPERYIYLRNKKTFFDELKVSGCQFQLNLLSLTGHYGTSVQELAQYLVKKEYYDYAGTDLHNARHLASLQKLQNSTVFSYLKDSSRLKNHLL
jgi:tyrosine-protein phosphatase YwqE